MILLVALLACGPADDTAGHPVTYPRLLAERDDKATILDRLDDEPYDAILVELDEQAALPLDLVDDPMTWDHDRYGRNASIAQSAAMRAWLFDDDAAAGVAIAALDDFATDFENNDTWDVNIRMPGPLIGFGPSQRSLPLGPRGSFSAARRAVSLTARLTSAIGSVRSPLAF